LSEDSGADGGAGPGRPDQVRRWRLWSDLAFGVVLGAAVDGALVAW